MEGESTLLRKAVSNSNPEINSIALFFRGTI